MNKKVATVIAVAGLLIGSVASANAASKTITCYKGTTVKKVTAAAPKCPAGYTTTAPKASAPAASKGGTIAINATYKGKVTMVWGASDVTVTSVTATGSGTTGGLDSLTGNGTSAPTEQCTPFDGEGTLGSGADTLKVQYADGSMACAADADAPTVVTIKKGPLKIISGTGKFAGATGTLSLTGSWAVASASKGTKAPVDVTLTLTGSVTTK